MGLPTEQDNLAGYVNASLLNKVHKIKSNKLLLVHGSSDGECLLVICFQIELPL